MGELNILVTAVVLLEFFYVRLEAEVKVKRKINIGKIYHEGQSVGGVDGNLQGSTGCWLS